MKYPDNKPTVKLVGEDGNASVILGKTVSAITRAGADKEYIEKYKKEAMSGDYDNLLFVTSQYVNII